MISEDYKVRTKPSLITYGIVTSGFILLMLEVVVRLFHMAPPLTSQYSKYTKDQYLPYKPRPFSIISGRSEGEFDYEYKHNSLGFRDIEHTIKKPEGIYRILGLGDSFTYGVGVKFEETYLYKLEKLLNNRQGIHPRIEIIKMGIPRFFPEVERLVLQHYGLQFQPDLILVGFLPNDITDTYMGIGAISVAKNGYLKTTEAEKLGEVGTWLYVNSHLFRRVLSSYVSNAIKNKYPIYWDDIYKPNGYHEKDWRKLELEYKKMIELASQINAKIGFIYIPQKGPWDDAHSYPSRRLYKYSKDNGVTFIDNLPAIKNASIKGEELYYDKDGHCNSEGHRVIAETVYSKLIGKSLVP